MTLQAAMRSGRLLLLPYSASDATREQYLKALENERRAAVLKRRLYYGGEQYDEDNATTKAAEKIPPEGRLPEHMRLHAYSTQIQESVDYLATELAKKFSIEAADESVQQVIETTVAASPDVSGDDETTMHVANVLRDALVAGDTPVRVFWSDEFQTTAWEFWESEAVEFRYDERNRHRLVEVVRLDVEWEPGPDGEDRQVMVRYVWKMELGECVRLKYRDDSEDEPIERVTLGVPFIPWSLLRAVHKTLRATRGESAITEQVMQSADRYNAVEQVAWLIARYNSHGNLGVVGDAAVLEARQEAHISKDVADVLTFPGGTNLMALTLPTDAQMIEHQRAVLLDSMHGSFGLARIDATTVQGLGSVSGYALEILNRKTDGTFGHVGKTWASDLKSLIGLTLNAFAWWSVEAEADDDEDMMPTPEDAEKSLFDPDAVDPISVYPNRDIEVRMGNGYIVDDTRIRDDFVAQLISRREALRQRGFSDEEIDGIEEEIENETPPEPEVGLSAAALRAANGGTMAGRTLSAADG